MKLKEIIKESNKRLKILNIEDSSIKVRLLIEYVFKIPKEQIILNEEKELEENKLTQFYNLLEKIENGMPIQYITNKQEFMGLNFYVDENVLIPQPDTEILVEEVIKYIRKHRENKLRILDLCTGSGIIAISIAKYLKNVEIYASDISEKALDVAKRNAKSHNVNIKFICSDMFKNIKEKEFDIIVSNPPYIESNVINTLSKEVQKEPKLALDGGEDGLKFYETIIKNARNYIKQSGSIFLEIGYNQKEKIKEIFNSYKYYSKIKCVKDLAGNDRVIIIDN